jgi:hypothetical protein
MPAKAGIQISYAARGGEGIFACSPRLADRRGLIFGWSRDRTENRFPLFLITLYPPPIAN